MAYLLARSLTFRPASATVLSANRFVTPRTSDGTLDYPALGGAAGYVTLDASSAGSDAGIACGLMDGAGLEIETGGAVANGARVTTDNQGRAVEADVTSQYVLGIAQQASSAAGEVITILTPSLFGGLGAHPDVVVPIAGILGVNRLVVQLAAGYGLPAATPFGATHVTLDASPAADQTPIRVARLNGAPVQVIAGAALGVGVFVSASANGAAIVAVAGTSISGVVTVAAAINALATITGIGFGYRVQ